MLNPHDKPRAAEVALVLLFILLAMAFAGGVDYQDELERENRTLRASAARCQMIQALREAEPARVAQSHEEIRP
jgi:hypothetical protein